MAVWGGAGGARVKRPGPAGRPAFKESAGFPLCLHQAGLFIQAGFFRVHRYFNFE
jgi:hypothetical protein